ncbi:hypothetical protein Q31b_42500 [Novipirellula aureliae]|uniref:Uncharacterized protein n=1 Tax=Novipirellula aureliae TaxID=2527966 RepID=A0A5C6DSD3_9BACT|nr:hypothetical protein [Novipirellula aureliae]TWU39165.1 hypothetical protein Q31b_42500 [Novipirellula aureliae]
MMLCPSARERTSAPSQRAIRDGATGTKAHQSDAVSGNPEQASAERAQEKTVETIVNDGSSGVVRVPDNEEQWAIQNSNL